MTDGTMVMQGSGIAVPYQRVIHAPEHGRFYDKNAIVILEVPCTSKEGMREPTVGDARKNGWRPSVSEVIKSLAKKYLDAWKEEHLLRCALANPIKEGEDPDEWVKRVAREAEVYGSLAADRGTEIHKQVKEYFDTQTKPSDEACRTIVAAIEERYKGLRVVPELPFSSELGWAGCVDLTIYDGDSIVIISDLKTREIAKFKKPGFEMGLQLGGYSAPLEEQAALESVISDRETGETQFFTWGEKWKRTESQTPDTMRKAFLHLFEVWTMSNKYDPRAT